MANNIIDVQFSCFKYKFVWFIVMNPVSAEVVRGSASMRARLKDGHF